MGYSDIKEMLTDAKNIATGANDIRLKGLLLDIQGAVYDLQEENRGLRDELHELKNARIIESNLIYHEGVYTNGDAVYCSVCWDRDEKLVRVKDSTADESVNKVYICDVCNAWRSSDIPNKK